NFEKFDVNTKIKKFKKKDIIYFESDIPKYLFFIESGKVKTVKNNKQDKELITGLFGQSDFFGYVPLFDNAPYDDEAIAMEESVIKLVPKEAFLKLINY